jgi:hypothetical protein
MILQNLSKMKYSQTNKNLSEAELQKKLLLNLMGIGIVILVVVLSLFVFAPKIGFLFGLVSKYRNAEGYRPQSKVAVPNFTNLPTASKDPQTKLAGYAQAGTTVVLFVNGPEAARTVTGSDGRFEFSDIKLNEGRNTLFAKAVDSSNNESVNTDLFYITYDKTGPEIKELSPKDGDVVRNLDKRITITGKISEKALITINGKTAVQKPDFSFDFLLGVEEGSVKIKIEVADEAGNTIIKEITVRYEKKSI